MSEQNKIDEIKAENKRLEKWLEESPECKVSGLQANENITYLLAEADRLQQESKRFEKAYDNADKQYLKQEKLAAQLRKENERLRAEIERKNKYLERISVTFGEFECQRLAREAL